MLQTPGGSQIVERVAVIEEPAEETLVRGPEQSFTPLLPRRYTPEDLIPTAPGLVAVLQDEFPIQMI